MVRGEKRPSYIEQKDDRSFNTLPPVIRVWVTSEGPLTTAQSRRPGEEPDRALLWGPLQAVGAFLGTGLTSNLIKLAFRRIPD